MINKPEYIIIHHSFTKDGKAPDWEAIKQYHIEVKKWNNIGYHLGIEDVNGKLELKYGRPIWECGAHALDFNCKSIGICIVGNYDLNMLSLAKKTFLAKIILPIQTIFNIPINKVIGHWETYQIRNVPIEKTCPGKNINMDELRSYIDSFQYK